MYVPCAENFVNGIGLFHEEVIFVNLSNHVILVKEVNCVLCVVEFVV
jgi:hypothetical protein